MSKKISANTRQAVYQKFNGHCAYCGIKLEYNSFHVDHIEPLFRKSTNEELKRYGRKKGANHVSNYNPSCRSCNSSKSTYTIEKFRESLSKKVHALRRDSSQFRILERFGKISCNEDSVVFYFEKFER